MDTNCKNNKFNLDHVYCHSNDSNYIRATKSSGTVDIMTLLKENKQLKAMLLLHLDLIQEQSDQLQAKDKLLATLKEENENMKIKIENLESEKNAINKLGIPVQENNTKLSIGIGGRNSYHRVHGKAVESSDLYKKVNKNTLNFKHEEKKENLAEYSNIEQKQKSKLILSNEKTSTTATITTRSRHTPTPPGGQIQVQSDKYKIVDENSNSGVPNSGSIIGQSNGKPISKIMLQLHRVKIPDNILPNKLNNVDDKSDSEISSFNIQLASIFENKEGSPKSPLCSPPLLPPITRSPKWFRKTASPTNLSLSVPLSKKSKVSKMISETKIEPLDCPLSPLLDPKSEIEIKEEIKHEDTEDGFSCESSGPDIEPIRRFIRCKSRQSIGESSASSAQQLSETILSNNSTQDSQAQALSPVSKTLSSGSKNMSVSNNSQIVQIGNISSFPDRCSISDSGRRKVSYLSTRKLYSAREWTTEGIPAEEFTSIKEEEEALKAEQPMLEIPKWTVKEVSCLYSIESTEDLSDETFRKRHAKLEHDEKRRKKWDVQRIREQRTIERLKRRHCKEEIVETENQELASFYPTPDQIKFIQISEELPVEAFGGELIPRLNPSEFQLPWRKHSHLNRICETNSETQTDNLQQSSKYPPYHSRHQTNQLNDSSITGSGSATGVGTSSNTASTFLFIKKRKKPQSTCTRRQHQQLQQQKINPNSSNIINNSNLSFNLNVSSTNKNVLFGTVTSPGQNNEDKNLIIGDSNVIEKVQHSSNLNNEIFNL
ncbi:uncharacterized protein LOC129615910 [Condylostylus longicornis]|uniref:uncharacterized protein LOC129615910 n=1 Tax=Condylostylus longicornis TaxID=2530218 RepID=UPI00244E50C5|nr:uncharacterized protein LOC129615910 [Condylostylus longicornis]